MNIYEFVDVEKRYKDNVAVKDISFQISEGSIVGFVGKNGSGKTTILRMMGNLLIPSSGKIYFKGKDFNENSSDLLQKIGIFLDPERSLYWRLTGIENLQRVMQLKDVSLPEGMKQIENFLEKAGMKKAIKQAVRTYSKGMKAKILLAACFIGSPEVLLLDEPFEGLDFQSKKIVMDYLKAYKKAGGTIIMTAHNLVDIQTLCDKVFWFAQGRLLMEGAPEKLVNYIAGEGVIRIISNQIENIVESVSKADFSFPKQIIEEDSLYILSEHLGEDFIRLKECIDASQSSIELHVKGLEDLYFFHERTDMYEKTI